MPLLSLPSNNFLSDDISSTWRSFINCLATKSTSSPFARDLVFLLWKLVVGCIHTWMTLTHWFHLLTWQLCKGLPSLCFVLNNAANSILVHWLVWCVRSSCLHDVILCHFASASSSLAFSTIYVFFDETHYLVS